MSESGNIRTTYTARGLPRYELEVRHQGLNKYQLVRSDDPYVLQQKASCTMARWDQMWEQHLQHEQQADRIADLKALAAQRSGEAQETLDALGTVLKHTLTVDDAIQWDALKDLSDFRVPQPTAPQPPPKPAGPDIPAKPGPSDPAFAVKPGFLDKLLPSRRLRKEEVCRALLQLAEERWVEARKRAIASYNEQVRGYNSAIEKLKAQHTIAVQDWQKQRESYLRKREQNNAVIEQKRAKYQAGDPGAIHDYCDMVLSRSEYPDYFPQSYELEYNSENKILVVDYQLPSPDALPRLKQVTYVQSRDELAEKYLSDSEFNRLYDSLLYQLALRTLHELYEADKINGLLSIVFNGYVCSTDRATGRETNACVLSVQASKEEFLALDLANVDPKACFRKLKGVGSSQLHSLAPVAPLLTMDRTDSRFVDSYAVAGSLHEGDNLAAMDWEDFEHLVRELFEEEFASEGGEVKITRASRDGGVDAVVFDPDPIRGGKIVIQAKRYSDTVGVSAVRDLYGTVINEGASKGILVTTADYGPDAYDFAKDKPLVLLSGSNLLHLLEKHGHKARIDLPEARKLLADEEKR